MGLDLDEILFSRVSKYLKRSREKKDKSKTHRVALDSIKERLTLLARAATGIAIDIYPAEREGGVKNNSFFLPSSFDFLPEKEDNIAFYIYRVLYLAVQHKLGINWQRDEDNLYLSRQKAKESSQTILTHLFEEYPSYEGIHHRLHQYFVSHSNAKIP